MPIMKKIDKSFFKTWTSDMAYILGFMFADGNIIRNKRGAHFFAIYTSDKNLLVKMRKCMGSNHKISERPGIIRVGYSIQIGSKEMFEDLGRLGLTPNKSKRMKLPFIPDEYAGHFIRGYFDGDGNVWTGLFNKKRKNPRKNILASFTSVSVDFLNSLYILLGQLDIKGGSIYIPKIRNFGRLTYSSKDALKLYEIMYNEPHRLFLQRKKSVFERFSKMRS
ncbi:MAG: LAGLIDADG family homing endonuclease [Candidatus Pacebacteria bacterium]|nr:LAGLIDADG family homing endonuclease [Candidatus Paceibacterota bacterium]